VSYLRLGHHTRPYSRRADRLQPNKTRKLLKGCKLCWLVRTERRDTEKVEELSQKVDELGSKLGLEFVALADALQNMDPNSADGRQISSIFDKLDKLCQG
jgi:hypothetical protein